MRPQVILDLCSGSGAWSAPYAEAGYDVRRVEVADGTDVRLLTFLGRVHGILAAPPCTHLSSSGARWWAGKGTPALLEALSVADACLRLIVVCRPAWWCLENPVGRLCGYLGPPAEMFDPCDYGDPWRKKTCLWGSFTMPPKSPVEPVEKSPIHWASPSAGRTAFRSRTPDGFAKAFFAANP